MRHISTGPKGQPTRGFLAAVDHSTLVHSVTATSPGGFNDKTMVRFDAVMRNLKSSSLALADGTVLGDVEFKLHTSSGEEIIEKGVYSLTDNGFHRWRCCQCPITHWTSVPEYVFSSRVESIRKDSECFFGRLKRRFRILKLPIQFHKEHEIDNVVFSCAIIHNMVLVYDGRDMRWADDNNYVGQEGLHGDADISPEDIDILSPQRVRTRDATTGHLVARSVRPTDDFSLPPSALPDLEAEDAHYILRNKLVEHLHYKWLNRELSWTK